MDIVHVHRQRLQNLKQAWSSKIREGCVSLGSARHLADTSKYGFGNLIVKQTSEIVISDNLDVLTSSDRWVFISGTPRRPDINPPARVERNMRSSDSSAIVNSIRLARRVPSTAIRALTRCEPRRLNEIETWQPSFLNSRSHSPPMGY